MSLANHSPTSGNQAIYTHIIFQSPFFANKCHKASWQPIKLILAFVAGSEDNFDDFQSLATCIGVRDVGARRGKETPIILQRWRIRIYHDLPIFYHTMFCRLRHRLHFFQQRPGWKRCSFRSTFEDKGCFCAVFHKAEFRARSGIFHSVRFHVELI